MRCLLGWLAWASNFPDRNSWVPAPAPQPRAQGVLPPLDRQGQAAEGGPRRLHAQAHRHPQHHDRAAPEMGCQSLRIELNEPTNKALARGRSQLYSTQLLPGLLLLFSPAEAILTSSFYSPWSNNMRYLHTMLRVRNLDAALKLYHDALGLKEVR